MKSLSSTFLPVAMALALGSASQALGNPQGRWGMANACGNQDTTPALITSEPVSPPTLGPGGDAPSGWNPRAALLDRGGSHYVAGNFIRVRLITDRCTSIVGVRYGSRVLTTQGDQGFWYAVLQASPPPSDPAHSGHNVTVFFPPQSDGSSEVVTVTVGRTGGTGTVDARFRVVHVSAVEATDVSASIGISRAEIFNMFSRALADKFGPANSTVISADGSDWRIYGYDPNTLSVTVNGNGIGFQFKFKTDIPYYCDPTVRAFGTFKLDAGLGGLEVNWVNPAQASLTWPGLCQIPNYFLINGIITNMLFDLLEAEHASSIAAVIEEEVLAALGDPGSGTLFLDGSTTRTNELLVNLKLPAPSISIRVPYDAFDLSRGATPFGSGELLMLVASGLGMSDAVAGVTPPTNLFSGPNGVPRAGTTTFPRPQAVARTGSLVWNGQPVGLLLARSQPAILQTRTFAYEPGCSILTQASPFGGSPWVRFGVNDTVADAQRLRGIGAAPGYNLRVHFLDEGLSDIAPRCPSITSEPPIASALER